uniref:Zinc finger protein 513 n=1 Tax=Cacopsylla melanoneura TaxID=428564 RepID=A0A8D8SMZ0_9HEMI
MESIYSNIIQQNTSHCRVSFINLKIITYYYSLLSQPSPDQLCSHCKMFSSSSINDWIEHCKSCTFMPRPDSFRHKYVCFACPYFTYNIGNIKRHLNIHLGEKPYTCPLCEYSCRESQSLKLHAKKYHM